MRAAIIGLGRIGRGFEDDPKRRGVWSHAGAYRRADDVALVAGVDVSADARDAFASASGSPAVYADYREMLEVERPDLVSICTPTALHEQMAIDAAEAGVQAIFCEKPIAATPEGGRRMIAACAARGVVLAVNHTRRWDRDFLWPRDLVVQGVIGTPRHVVGWYSGGIYSMGTHLFDTIAMLTGAEPAWAGADSQDRQRLDDPAIGGWLGCAGNLQCAIVASPAGGDLIFEIDVLGSGGRLRIADNGARVEVYDLVTSSRYSGYRELEPRASLENPFPPGERFVDAVNDIVRCVHHGGAPACGSREGLQALETADALLRSVAQQGARVPVAGSALQTGARG